MVDISKFTKEQIVAVGLQVITCMNGPCLHTHCPICDLDTSSCSTCTRWTLENPNVVLTKFGFDFDSFLEKEGHKEFDALEKKYVDVCNEHIEANQMMNYEHGRAEAYQELLMKMFGKDETDDKK